jgi:hypothetical protein
MILGEAPEKFCQTASRAEPFPGHRVASHPSGPIISSTSAGTGVTVCIVPGSNYSKCGTVDAAGTAPSLNPGRKRAVPASLTRCRRSNSGHEERTPYAHRVPRKFFGSLGFKGTIFFRGTALFCIGLNLLRSLNDPSRAHSARLVYLFFVKICIGCL